MSIWNTISKFIAPALGAVGGSELGGLTGWAGAQTLGGALGGALGGGLTNGAKGAVLGGAGGAIYPNIGDISSSIESLFGPNGGGGYQSFDMAGGGQDQLIGSAAADTAGVPAQGAIPGTPSAVSASNTPNFSDLQYDPDGNPIPANAAVPGPAGAPTQYDPDGNQLPLNTGVPGPASAAAIDPGEQTKIETAIHNITNGAPNAGAGVPLPTSGGTAPGGIKVVNGQLVAPPAAAEKGLLERLGITGMSGTDLAKLGLTGASLGYSATQSNQPLPYGDILKANAEKAAALGSQLTDPLTGGPLPAGAQSALDQATASAKASIRSRFASMGMSGSSAERNALAQADSEAVQQRFQIAQQMAQTGFQQAGLSNTIYGNLANAQLQQDNELSDAIAQAAAAFAAPPVSIRLGK